ncbi:MAG: hypothetical protein AAFR51_02755 [Pseudomonadota bacterium]
MTEPAETSGSNQNRLLVRLSLLQTIPAVVGIFIATVALFAALNESDAVRKQQQAAVWPHVQVDRSNITTDTNMGVKITVSNRGIGPARIRAAEVALDGETVLSWDDLFERLAPAAQGRFPRSDSHVGSSVLVPGSDVTVIDLDTAVFTQFDLESMDDIASREETATAIQAFRTALRDDRFEMTLCYCSVFDDCWQVSNVQRDPAPINACSAPELENDF